MTNTDLEFLDKLAPVIAGQKISLPASEFCPECCKIQRLAWRNEKKLFRRKCDFSGKDIVSIFPPDSPYKIYEEDLWYSDAWDAKSYAREIDFSRPFFPQFDELMRAVPVASRATQNCENSDYCHASSNAKNCYLSFSIFSSEDMHYSVDMTNAKSGLDCISIYESENCYECSLVFHCYNVQHSYDLENCRDSSFLLSCKGCTDCYGCFDLQNKQYYIYNTEYSREEYVKRIRDLKKLPMSEQKKRFELFYQGRYVKYPLKNTGSENVIQCENVINSNNASYCRNVNGAQNIRYVQKLAVPGANLVMHFTSF